MRDRCPGALLLHEAGDGRLARIRIPGGRIESAHLVVLAAAADLGNGLVDLTSRANIQVRGLPDDVGPRLVEVLERGGLLPTPSHDRVRNIMGSPLAGRHPKAQADSDPIVNALDEGLCADPALAHLPGRFMFAVDDGSGGALPSRADVALVAEGRSACRLALAGIATAVRVSASEAAPVALEAARAFLDVRGSAWRVSDTEGGASALAAQMGTATEPRLELPADLRATPGRLTQRDGMIAVTGMARLGRLDARTLRMLSTLERPLRLSPARTVTVCDVTPADVAALERLLARADLDTEPESGWTGLTACAGVGACAHARVDVRSLARQRASLRSPGSPAEHWSACERRCGERPGQPISIAPEGDPLIVRTAAGESRVESEDDALSVLA